jgi:crotonobetainyl-CoA:carnitine CoA-transferase CaiB-like acyl-CoA transferase
MRPLDGIRVLSLATQYPGPFATMLLADLGADVVIVERPGTGDPGRRNATFFATLNRGKRSLALDLKTEKDKTALLKLVDRADVFIEGFRPGVAARLGFGYEELSKRNPRLVYASISAFGQTGPYRNRPAHDLSLQALVGLLHGREEGATRGPFMAWSDLASGTFAALGIASALVRRTASGKGSMVDVAMSDTLAVWLAGWYGPVLHGEKPFTLEYPGFGCYRCADGKWLSLSITFEDHLWRPLAEAVGIEEFAGLDIWQRGERYSEIEALLKNGIAARPFDYWAKDFTDKNIAWAPVLSPEEATRDPHLRARGMFVERKDGKLPHWYVVQPVIFDGETPPVAGPSPELGDTDPDSVWS